MELCACLDRGQLATNSKGRILGEGKGELSELRLDSSTAQLKQNPLLSRTKISSLLMILCIKVVIFIFWEEKSIKGRRRRRVEFEIFFFCKFFCLNYYFGGGFIGGEYRRLVGGWWWASLAGMQRRFNTTVG